jgi:phosphoglycerate dehydrogenase-like enzyme
MPKILLLDEPHPKARKMMEEFAECQNVFDQSKPFVITRAIPGDIIYTQLTPIKTNIPVFCPCTGIDHIEAPNVIYLDDEWKQNEGELVTSTAEHTWSLILQLAKMNRMQLRKKIIGVIGIGRIGWMVYKYAKAFKMVGRIYNKNRDAYDFEKLIKQSDIITLHVPLNSETRGMISKNEFAMMKPGALLVNTSRAEIVNEPALMDALESGTLGGYADDFYHNHESGRLKFMSKYGDKVILTDHIGGNCLEAREATDIYIAQKMREWFK